MVKISILLLYRRVFDTKRIKIITSVLGALCLAWGAAAIFSLIFQCHPISGMWTPEDTFTEKCFDLKAYYTSVSATNMALDIVLLSIPLYMIWGLGLPRAQKVGLTLIFLLGGLLVALSTLKSFKLMSSRGCVASLMRIVTVHFIKGADLPCKCPTTIMTRLCSYICQTP